jgi:manganese-dependent inorganic pyrophosphatase
MIIITQWALNKIVKEVTKLYGQKKNDIYVIGHINPDTDSIASAMGYAWLLNDQFDVSVTAARAGQLNPQTTWVLDRLQLDPPILLSDASPRFESIAQRFDTTTPDRPLRDVWVIANRTGGVAPVVNEDGTPYGLVTVLSLFRFLMQSIGAHPRREDTRIAEIMELPCRDACDIEVPYFQASNRIRDSLSKILHEERSEFWVVDENGRYAGVFRQRDALNPPRLRLILVDHNEPGQALGALDEADLIEILDHHRLGNNTTRTPIRFTVDVVGSTCTLVSERIREAGLSAPPKLAGLLLAGLVSDTLKLSSPTTTARDHIAAERLGRWAFVGGSPLQGETVESFAEKVLEAGASLASRDPADIIMADFKLYEAGGMQFGISQVEVVNRSQVKDHLPELRRALIELRDKKGLDFVMLMITDVVRTASHLLLTNEVPGLDDLPYPRRDDGTFSAEGVVSRKMQLLPMLLGALEG